MTFITLLSMAGGFLARLLPELLDVWKLRLNNKHELALQRMNLEAAKLKVEGQLASQSIEADLTEARSVMKYMLAERELLNNPPPKSGMPLVDGLNSSIRSIVTLWVLSLYTYTKMVKVEFVSGITTCDQPVFFSLDMLQEIWGPEDTAMLGAIIGYHFGAQAAKFLRRYAAR